MFRKLICSAMMLFVCGCGSKTDHQGKEGTLTSVDAAKRTAAVKMKANGKDVDREFKLAENIEYMDSTGKVATADIFTSGDMVFIVEREGTITKMSKKDKMAAANGTAGKDKAGHEVKTDKDFVQMADQTSLAEIKLGKLAEEHAANGNVKKFGERTVRDHSAMNKELRDLTSKQGISLTEKLDQKHQTMADDLSKLKGADFDRAYTKDMVAGHEKAVEQFETETKSGVNSDTKAWATKWLPTLREHLTMAREASKDVNGK